MGRQRDQFWDHAKNENGRFKCNYCKQDFPGGASRIKAHLAGIPGHDIKACNAVPQDVQEKAQAITQKKREAQATQETNKKLKSTSTSASKLKTKDKEGYMAEIVLNDVVERLIANAFSLIATENIGFESSFKVELKIFLETLFKIKFLLDDAQKRQSSDESVRIWLMKLRDVAYHADNVLDEFSYESFWQEVQTQNLMVDQVRSFSFCNPAKVKPIKQSLDKIVHDAAGFGLRMELVNSIPNISLDMNIDPLLDDSEFVGREYDVMKILNVLISSSNQVISVLPIVGVAGIGKTTLAKVVYNNELIKEHFDVLAWVNVGKNFDVQGILEGILKESLREYLGDLEYGKELEICAKILRAKKYLLILDDVQNEDPKKWDALKAYLLEVNSNTGNNIVITTRSDNVGQIMKIHHPPHHLEKLSKDDCWSIMKKRTLFIDGRAPLNLDLEVIGREIAKRCGGVPWAARVLGGTMCFQFDKNKWLEIQNNKIWDLLYEDNSDMFHVLKLCFDQLPTPSLKRCFTYCAIFPKDYYMKKDEVIQYWMAEGFLEPAKEVNAVMEDIGNMYFNILLATSFFQNARMDNYEDGYRITELGALKNLKGEIVIKNLEKVKDEEEAKSAKLKEKEIFKLGLYWSFKREEDDMYDRDEKVLEGLQPHPNLKSLSIEFYGGKKFPSWVGLSSLYHNLIEISLYECSNCEEVPTLGQLPCLRVLEMKRMRKVRCIGSEFYFYSDGSFRNTTTLFPALRILKLEMMDSLEEWKDAKELTTADEVLFVFPCLEELIIRWCDKLGYLPGVPSVIQHLEIVRCGINELPSGLQFCTSLQYLEIKGCPNLESIPDLGELFHSLINLKLSNSPFLRLKLRREGRSKTLAIGGFIEELGALPILRYSFIRYSHASLKKLTLHGSPTLNSLPDEIQLFTALEELRIQNFNGMEALPDWFSYLSSLQKLSLFYCKKLMYLPILHLTNLKHLQIDLCRNFKKRCAEGSGAVWFQIAHIPNIKINKKCIKGKDSVDFDDYDEFDEEVIFEPYCFYDYDYFDEEDFDDSDDSEDDRDDYGLQCVEYLENGDCRLPSTSSIHPSLQKLKLSIRNGSLSLLALDQIQYFIALKILWIEGFNGMVALPEWLGNLSSLQRLYIVRYWNLAHLPTEEAMRRLTQLKTLIIYECPNFEDNERIKISHVPWVKINDRWSPLCKDFEDDD
ncbi:hypothetical protein RGQ29_002314 [Quercus rubra]|uniref:BED-type domain-containing protein n=1 Tax=Quercus rubra TaxID=3512 RepID=A0AAN7IDK7_QUERU|nr:hypothetical protein RGQ29_002314 [Quercus rubra]